MITLGIERVKCSSGSYIFFVSKLSFDFPTSHPQPSLNSVDCPGLNLLVVILTFRAFFRFLFVSLAKTNSSIFDLCFGSHSCLSGQQSMSNASMDLVCSVPSVTWFPLVENLT